MELQFSSSILTYPDRYNTGGEEYRDGEAPVPGSLPSLRDAVEREDTPASHPSEEYVCIFRVLGYTVYTKKYVGDNQNSHFVVFFCG